MRLLAPRLVSLGPFCLRLDDCPNRQRFLALTFLCLAVLSLPACGDKSENGEGAQAQLEADLTATQILAKVRDAYSSSKSYSDHGEFILRYRLEGQLRQENHSYELAFRRPNELHLRLFNASLIGDASETAFAVNDPSTNHMDQQVVVRDATQDLDLSAFFADPIVAYFAAGGTEIPLSPQVKNAHVELAHPALALLTNNTPPSWFGEAKSAKRIKNQTIDGKSCYRIQIETPFGEYVAWVDAKSWLIRRLEYPTKLLDPQLAESPQVRELEMYAELKEAEFDTSFPKTAFDFNLPDEVHKVRHFVTLPEPFPSELIGRKPSSFELPVLGGTTLSESTLQGKVTALLWMSSDPICEPIVRQFGQVRGKVESELPLQLITVCTEPQEKLNDVQLIQLVRDWDSNEMLARGDQTIGLGVFDVRALPTIVVLDEEGVIQFYRTVTDGALEEELVAVLARVARGENVAAEMRDDYQKYLDEYQDQLAQASDRATDSNAHRQGGTTPVTAASPPRAMDFEFLWRSSSFRSAGNILVVRDQGQERIFVLDGFRTVAELDQQGNEISRHELDLPDGVAITSLRRVRDDSQVAFVGGSILGQSIWVFDDRWNTVGKVPDVPNAELHSGIRDFDVNVNEMPNDIVVAYWKEKGIARFSPQGTMTGENTRITQANSIIPFSTSEGFIDRYLVASNDGVLRVLDYNLQLVASPSVDGFGITHLFPAQLATESAANRDRIVGLGMAPIDDRKSQLVGFDANFTPKWSHTISADVFDNEIRFVFNGSIRVPSSSIDSQIRCWFVARPDGTVYVFSEDGNWNDQFALGFTPTGIALSQTDDESILLVSHQDGVVAWRVAKVPSISERERDETQDR